MKDTLAFCIAICMMIGQFKGSFAIPSLQTTGGRCKPGTMNENSIKINGMLMIENIRAYFHENE